VQHTILECDTNVGAVLGDCGSRACEAKDGFDGSDGRLVVCVVEVARNGNWEDEEMLFCVWACCAEVAPFQIKFRTKRSFSGPFNYSREFKNQNKPIPPRFCHILPDLCHNIHTDLQIPP